MIKNKVLIRVIAWALLCVVKAFGTPRTCFSCGALARRSVWAASAVLAACLAAGLVSPGRCLADSGCHWEDTGWFISCSSKNYVVTRGTGCLGLHNNSGQTVRVLVNSGDGTNVHKRFSSGKHQKADFKGDMALHTCKTKNDKGEWEKVRCNSVFSVTENRNGGGGCGCKNYGCLPGW